MASNLKAPEVMDWAQGEGEEREEGNKEGVRRTDSP